MSWDGKIYDKYRIEHADGTPLKGKKYFVLRLDSDDPVEAARIAAAMRAYKSEPRNCERFATVKDAAIAFARERQDAPQPCPDFTFSAWLLAPATEKKEGAK